MPGIGNPWAVARAGARGLVAAMAMTGVRTFSGNVGLLERSPPEEIMHLHAPEPVQQLVSEHRTAITELVHWSYGAVGGAVFGLLSPRVRAHPATGPVYGLGFWLTFELALAPLLGVGRSGQRGVLGRAVLAADHLLYGVVVAGRLAPEAEVVYREHGPRRGP